MEILNKHVTIRKFKNEPVSDELLYSMIYSGTRASTTGNMQLYSIVVNRKGKIKDQLVPLHFNQPVASGAPVLLTFVADVHRFSLWCRVRDATPGYNNFLWFLNAMTDTLLVAQNVCIAAENAGLGICYLGTTLYNAPEIIEVLKLPGLTFPITTVALGWPDENPDFTDRIPLSGIIHQEFYNDYNEKGINELFSLKEDLLQNKKFISENKKDTLPQVFTDERYKESDNRFFSDKVLHVLQEQGFLEI